LNSIPADKELLLPKNDNLRSVLANIDSYDLLGSKVNLWPEVENMLEINNYKRLLQTERDSVELQLASGEDIAKHVIKEANEKIVGITGSDFVIEELYRRPSFNFADVDPRDIIDDCSGIGLPEKRVYEFEGRNGSRKIVRMELIDDHAETRSRLCLMGPKDKTFDFFITEMLERNEMDGRKNPVSVVCEYRFRGIGKAFSEREFKKYSLPVKMHYVTRTTEGWQGKKGDVIIEIGSTFNTARKNNLVVYAEIMKTYPVVLQCRYTD
jgi:hypothetical protein